MRAGLLLGLGLAACGQESSAVGEMAATGDMGRGAAAGVSAPHGDATDAQVPSGLPPMPRAYMEVASGNGRVSGERIRGLVQVGVAMGPQRAFGSGLRLQGAVALRLVGGRP